MTGRPPRSTLFPYATLSRPPRPAPATSRTPDNSRGSTPRAPTSARRRDRKSTRLNSSHSQISYFVFFLNDRPPTEIYPLPLRDPLPTSSASAGHEPHAGQ